MSDRTPSDEEGVFVVDSGDIPGIREALNRSVADMTKAIENIEKHDASYVVERAANPVWAAEMDRHLRHFHSSKAVVEYGAWVLEQAQLEKSEKAARELAAAQARLSSRLNWISAVMTAAVIVQAFAAVVAACRGGG